MMHMASCRKGWALAGSLGSDLVLSALCCGSHRPMYIDAVRFALPAPLQVVRLLMEAGASAAVLNQ